MFITHCGQPCLLITFPPQWSRPPTSFSFSCVSTPAVEPSLQTVALRLLTYVLSRLPSSSPQLAHSSLQDAVVISSSTSSSQRSYFSLPTRISLTCSLKYSLGYVPGAIHAFWLIYKQMQAEERYGSGGFLCAPIHLAMT